MAIERSTLILSLSLLFPLACQARPAIPQHPGRSLLPPQLVQSGYGLAAFAIAPLPGIPFRATIEAENEIVDEQGRSSIEHLAAQVVRNSRGRTRTDMDLKPVEKLLERPFQKKR
jgi:hypothetical protein